MGQPARSEKQKSYRYIRTQFSQMAGPRTRRNAGGAPINDSDTPIPTFAISSAPTAAPTQAPAPTLASALAFVPGPPGRYTDEDLQRATKLALESFFKGQEHGQLQASSEAEDPITWEEFKPIQTGFSTSTRVSARMGGTAKAPTIDLISIQPSRSPSQTHDA